MQWAKQTDEELERTRLGVFGKLHNIDMFHIAETSIKQMQSLQKSKVSIYQIVEDESDYGLSGDELEYSSRTKNQKEKKINVFAYGHHKMRTHEHMSIIKCFSIRLVKLGCFK